ncbi:DEAD/DEAH box helicase [Texcoconibacillus texcoconensis]|uniref:SNF2 family DNA or RNA helicase n=1 Tax=Texcoconibacillus texcoconensis TaxID=1095777 RepID=A0A840QPN2_9BACI|nr:DEAD/DEAH box helicase [Texcoconibacillus texcoconensis]MBB5173372.1 SNF2 family DNA or RNA helicase [Texcoconibacillus texcoconensis]
MGILTNFKKNRKSIQLSVERRTDYLAFRMIQEGTQESVTLPLQLTIREIRAQEHLAQLEMLEELWYDNFLEEANGEYRLEYRYLYEMTEEMRAILGLPKHVTHVDAMLSHDYFVGSTKFKILLEKGVNNWKHVERTADCVGPLIILPNGEEFLMSSELYEFEQQIQNAPSPMDETKIFEYIAKVRNQARKLNIPMDKYLEKQEYLLIDGLDVDVTYQNDQIELIPRYSSTDDIDPQVIDEMSSRQLMYYQGQGDEKIFLDQKVQDNAKSLQEVEPIKGSDIPKCINNPEAFIPNIADLNLDNFGERVKELGIKVYRAQPYVHANENERGWFDIDVGVQSTDDEGEVIDRLDLDIIDDMVHASNEGEEFIQKEGQWIQVPDDISQFQQAVEDLNEDKLNHHEVSHHNLPYVLEIFENIDRLEYNQPILQVKQDMKDKGVLDTHPPDGFKASLKPFQIEGFVWMKSLNYKKLGGLLADDMGLGKTVQVIAFLTYLRQMNKLTPTLIIVPKTLVQNWKNEISTFAPELGNSIYIHQGSSRHTAPQSIKNYDIVITTYQTLVRDQLVLGQINWMATICDEAQAIKNPTTSSSKVIKALKTHFRLALTGTPVENSLSELWSIMDYVQPGLLGSLKEFKDQFITPYESGRQDVSGFENHLTQRIASVYKRRTKDDELGDQIPQKTNQIHEVLFGPEQKKLYEDVVIKAQNKDINGLEAIGELKKISSHPALTKSQLQSLPPKKVPKLAETLNILKGVKKIGEKALIFTEYRQMQVILKEHIAKELNVNPMIINGGTNKRQEHINDFNHKCGFDVMILSPKAAGTGLTITSANHVIHYTRWWNPAVENQATDRVHRIGQGKGVTVYYPIVKGSQQFNGSLTVEEIVNKVIEDKKELAGSVIVPDSKLDIEDEVLKEVKIH